MNPARVTTDMQKATPDAVGMMISFVFEEVLGKSTGGKKKPNHLI